MHRFRNKIGVYFSLIGCCTLIVTCSVTKPHEHTCAAGDPYAGSRIGDAPDSLWNLPFDLNMNDRLDSSLASAFERTIDTIAMKVPGVSAVVAIPGEGVWAGARGVARTSPQLALPNVPLFQIASITKVYTAIAIMQLVEEGKISLQSPVSNWYPELPEAGLITIDQLLRHTSGIPSFNAIDTNDRAYIPPDSAITLAAKSNYLFCPGTNWSYSNTGYVILGRILEKEEKLSLDSIFTKRIFGPLDLKHTILRKHGDAIQGLVSGHLNGVPDSTDYATPFAAGSIVSTAFEVTKFWQAVLSGKLISKESVRSLFSDLHPMTDVADASYGRGVMLYNGSQGPGLMLGHSGGVTGFTSVIAYMIQDRAYVCVLFNDKQYAAEAGLWSLVRTLREFRANRLLK